MDNQSTQSKFDLIKEEVPTSRQETACLDNADTLSQHMREIDHRKMEDELNRTIAEMDMGFAMVGTSVQNSRARVASEMDIH